VTDGGETTARPEPDPVSTLLANAADGRGPHVQPPASPAAAPPASGTRSGSRPSRHRLPRHTTPAPPAWPQDNRTLPGPNGTSSGTHNGNGGPVAGLPAGRQDPGRWVTGRRDASRAWLRNAMAALAVLAIAAAIVSWDAQYVLVLQARHAPVIAALEAGIPDTGALIFAALGIALALHGKRALRPRALNVACIAISLAMNTLAAGHGARDVAIWIMPAIVYALASDTLIGVVRAWALARQHPTGQLLAGEDTTPLAIAGTFLLWLLRLALAPASTLAGFRRWVIEECPIAPGRTATAAPRARTVLPPPASAPPPGSPHGRRPDRRPGKQDLLIALASQRHDLRQLPLSQVARIAGQIGAEVTLHQGTARRVLMAHVKALQNGSSTAARTEPRS
jgi:hypothetical protein